MAQGTPAHVYVAIRASRQPGLFDLVTISDTFGSVEDAMVMLEMTEVEQLSTFFWPNEKWSERLSMLKRGAPTGQEQWHAAQEVLRKRDQRPSAIAAE